MNASIYPANLRHALFGLTLLLLCGCSDGKPSPETASNAQGADSNPQALGRTEAPIAAGEPKFLEINREDRLIARIQDRTAEELSVLMIRAEKSIEAWEAYPDFDPIEFILDGPEARLFVRSNYPNHRDLVDRAARLDAFGIIDVKICERWMEANEVMASDFPAFVDTVNYGPAAKRQLLREGYIYF